jgi:hypothetical protein
VYAVVDLEKNRCTCRGAQASAQAIAQASAQASAQCCSEAVQRCSGASNVDGGDNVMVATTIATTIATNQAQK